MNKITENMLKSVRRVHFIGIGGSGTYPIVEILNKEGFEITGSDNNPGDNIDRERAMGITVHMGHRAENLGDAQLVVYSAAIPESNPERQEAVRRGLPCAERSEMLGLLTRRYKKSIGIAGTHGKTTTSALLTQALFEGGYDPSAVIGGKLPAIGGSGRAGHSQWMVTEACEYSNTFLHLHSDIGVILGIDADHLEFFGSYENVVAAFVKFANQSEAVAVFNDDPGVKLALPSITSKVVTFGWNSESEFYPENIEVIEPFHTEFDLVRNGEKLARYTLIVPGRHNIMNAVAGLSAAITLGAEPEDLVKGLAAFKGAGRRFENLGMLGGVTVVDDYAHHPAELKATIETAKAMGYNRVWAVFQPFTYSRTAMLLDDFADVLSLADRVVITAIMGGREENTYGISDEALPLKVQGSVLTPSFEETADYVSANAEAGDLVLTMGCGDIYKCARMIVHRLSEQNKKILA